MNGFGCQERIGHQEAVLLLQLGAKACCSPAVCPPKPCVPMPFIPPLLNMAKRLLEGWLKAVDMLAACRLFMALLRPGEVPNPKAAPIGPICPPKPKPPIFRPCPACVHVPLVIRVCLIAMCVQSSALMPCFSPKTRESCESS